MILLIIITLYMLYVVMKIYYVLRIELLLFVNFRKGENEKKCMHVHVKRVLQSSREKEFIQ